MFYNPAYQGDNKTPFKTHSGKEIELTQDEMQSLFEILRGMESIDGSIPSEISELEYRLSDLENENDRLRNEVGTDYAKEELGELKQKLKDIVEEF